MRLLNLLTKSVFICSILAVSSVQANAFDGHTVLCPSNIEKIRQAAPLINKSQRDGGRGYTAFTDTAVFEENGLAWKVGMPFIDAQSDSEAIAIGQKGVANVVSLLNKQAYEVAGVLVCGYYISANVIAAAFVGDIDGEFKL